MHLQGALWTWSCRGRKDGEILSFSRKASTEIFLAAALSSVAVSNVAADYDSSVYASDASLRKGANVSSRQSLEKVKTLWLGGGKRGTYTKLDNPFKAALRSHGFDNEDDANEDPVPYEPARPKNSWLRVLTSALTLLRFVVGLMHSNSTVGLCSLQL